MEQSLKRRLARKNLRRTKQAFLPTLALIEGIVSKNHSRPPCRTRSGEAGMSNLLAYPAKAVVLMCCGRM